jgi:hypothetical protein
MIHVAVACGTSGGPAGEHPPAIAGRGDGYPSRGSDLGSPTPTVPQPEVGIQSPRCFRELRPSEGKSSVSCLLGAFVQFTLNQYIGGTR